MYICVCNAVSDKDIIEAVNNGAHDLATIQAELGASAGCGTCRDYTERLIKQTLSSSIPENLTYAA